MLMLRCWCWLCLSPMLLATDAEWWWYWYWLSLSFTFDFTFGVCSTSTTTTNKNKLHKQIETSAPTEQNKKNVSLICELPQKKNLKLETWKLNSFNLQNNTCLSCVQSKTESVLLELHNYQTQKKNRIVQLLIVRRINFHEWFVIYLVVRLSSRFVCKLKLLSTFFD